MTDESRYDLLRASVLGGELNEDECRILSQLITISELKDGDTLYHEGQSDNRIHVVVQGRLAIVKDSKADGKRETLNVLGSGDLAGELSFIDGHPHYAALRASGAARVFSLEREKLESLLEAHPWLVYRVMRAIMRVAHERLIRMSIQTSELSNYVFKQHGRY
jgi:CRP-like cAMP-binding protein